MSVFFYYPRAVAVCAFMMHVRFLLSCLCLFNGSFVLSICRCSLVLYSAGYGVITVHVVLSGLSMRLLKFVNVCI